MIAYQKRNGWLYTLDPRPKFWLALCGVGVSLITNQVPILITALSSIHLILLTGGLTASDIGKVWRALTVLLLFIMIGQPLFLLNEGDPLLDLGFIQLTDIGLLTAIRYGLRLSAAAFAALIPIQTTSPPTLVRGLEKLGLPYNWGLVIALALRYLGTLSGLYTSISEAQQARGVDLSQRGLIKRVQMALPTTIALIIASLRLSDSLALGLAARGFGMPDQRTIWRDITMRQHDWLVIGISGLITALLITSAIFLQ